ncbi:hypothetical protein J7643_05245 [bacterium]|nr:hypothetical protein [bacterium]
MSTTIGYSQSSRHRLPQPPQQRLRQPAARPVSDEGVRRMQADQMQANRMQIRKTEAMPQPKLEVIGAVLLFVALSLGLGVGLGGAPVAIGIGIGWLSIALVAFVWSDLSLAYHVWQSRR